MPIWPLAVVIATQDIKIKPASNRFELAYPLGLPPVTIDSLNDGVGLAQQLARHKGLQGRMLWIDGTANIDRVNTAQKVHDLIAKIKSVGFNTIVYDVKPISGQVLYQSKIAPKIESWKGKVLPLDFDPLEAMSHEAKAQGIELLVSLNAFSEGHSLFKVGPGYEHPEWQSVIYDPSYEARAGGISISVGSKPNEAPRGDSISVFTDPAKAPAGGHLYALDKSSRLSDSSEGAILLLGAGDGEKFLKAAVGAVIFFDTAAKFVPISEHPEQQYPLMTNLNNPEVQKRGLAIVEEIMRNYPVDGVLYDDRLRYGGLNADFSELTRGMFEAYVGKKLSWPDDVFKYTITPALVRGIRPGRYYEAWMAWRALQMRNWVARVRETVKRVRPGGVFGIYAGSWYGEYPQFGSNYAADSVDAGFWFLTNTYRKTGFASQLDVLVTGCYYPTATIYESMTKGRPIGQTVEAAGQLSNRLARDQAWTYAGLTLDMFKGDPGGLANALQAACASTQGVMVFDLSHDIEPMWPVFAAAFGTVRRAPHQVVGLIDVARKKRAAYDRMGVKDMPVPIAAGSGGVGF
jgi:hypothetical protein